MTINQ